MNPCRLLLALLLLGWAVVASSANSLEDVRQAFSEAHQGAAQLEAAAEVIDAYYRQHPGSALASVYAGSLRTIQGGKGSTPWKRMAQMNEGFALLDQAVTLAGSPTATDQAGALLEVLMVAGITNASVPAMFKRQPLARSNFESLLVAEGFQQMGAPARARVYAWLAVLLQGEDEQRSADYRQRALALDQQVAAGILDRP